MYKIQYERGGGMSETSYIQKEETTPQDGREKKLKRELRLEYRTSTELHTTSTRT